MNITRVAIDGPSGAGKSTLARNAARTLGYLYVDTGAIYRTIGCYAWSRRLDPKDGAVMEAALPDIHVDLSYGEDGLQRMGLNGEDVTEKIRLPEISLLASAVSAHPCVRSFLLGMQRDLARKNSVIMDGRDIGTVVLPLLAICCPRFCCFFKFRKPSPYVPSPGLVLECKAGAS